MSCEKCDKSQDAGMIAYFRWGKANIGITGCNEHVKEVMDVLRVAVKEKKVSISSNQ